jgi:menaquinone-dependent protoporphyrinogen oxidase
MRVLIVHGSKLGGTEGLARVVGETLALSGHTTEIRRASEPVELDAWDAVVIGGALYAGRWQRDARRFVERHIDELLRMPVWFFSSGPLDDSASKGNIAATPQVRRLMQRVHARGHTTFGGRLAADATGFIARALVRQGRVGDWRDLAAVRAWAQGLAIDLAGMTPAQPVRAAHGDVAVLRRVVAGLCVGTGLAALAGGVVDLAWLGNITALGLPSRLPFPSLLYWIAGAIHIVAGVLVVRRHRHGELVALGSGVTNVASMLGEMAAARAVYWAQATFALAGVSTVVAALWLWQRRHAALRRRDLGSAGRRFAANPGATPAS